MAVPSLPDCAAALERLTPDLLRAAAGSVVVLGVAGVTVLAMRRASAAARHEAWTLGFAAALLLPLLSAALPGWHVLPRPAAGQPPARSAAPAVAPPFTAEAAA